MMLVLGGEWEGVLLAKEKELDSFLLLRCCCNVRAAAATGLGWTISQGRRTEIRWAGGELFNQFGVAGR